MTQPEPVGCVDALERAHLACGERPALVLFPDHLVVPMKEALEAILRAWRHHPRDSTGLCFIQPEEQELYGRLCGMEAGGEGGEEDLTIHRLVPPTAAHPTPPPQGAWMTALGGVYTRAYFQHWRALCGSSPSDSQDCVAKNQLACGGLLAGVRLPGTLFDMGQPPGFHAAQKALGSGPGEERR